MQRDLEVYKKLYMIHGNKEDSIDYQELVECYTDYLYIYCYEKEKSNFYQNIEFLDYVVKGFRYFHNHIYVDSKYVLNEKLIMFLEKQAEILQNEYAYLVLKNNNSVSDLTCMITYSVLSDLHKRDISSKNVELLLGLVENSYLVTEAFNVNNKEGNRDGMEYWKHKN